MFIYLVTSDQARWYLRMDASQSSAPIDWRDSLAGNWTRSPFQSADAQHSPRQAAELLANYFGDQVGELAETVENVEEIR